MRNESSIIQEQKKSLRDRYRRNSHQSDCLPGHLPVRVFPPIFGGLLAGGTNHHSFLDHVYDIHGVHRIQEEDLIRSARRKNSRPCGLHSGSRSALGPRTPSDRLMSRDPIRQRRFPPAETLEEFMPALVRKDCAGSVLGLQREAT